MAGKRIKSTKTFLKNVAKHATWVVKREESIGEAIAGIRKDSRKLAKTVKSGTPSSGGKYARKLTEEARHAYNEHRYDEAEELLRSAIVEDTNYALAYTYLGHTLYKKNRVEEAIRYWTKATMVDPDSEAAQKAQRKIQVIAKQNSKMNAWIAEYMDSIKSG
jgi:tetratricopeptide (TPR) repeat protein